MTSILTVGVAVIDFVFSVDEMPKAGTKTRAQNAVVVGGGCAANAAAAISRLGGSAHLAARVGQDMVGDLIVSGLRDEGVDCSLVRRFENGRSSYSSVVVDRSGERMIVNYRDKTLDFGATWLASSDLPDFDAVLADTRWPEGARVAMEKARERGAPGILDAEPPVREAQAALGVASHIAFGQRGLLDFTGETDFETALRAAAAETGAWVCVTLGDKGVTWLEDDGVAHMPSFAVQAVDTLGAGDVWHGAFAMKLGEGAGEKQAIRFANAVAALKCTRFGGRAGAPRAAEVEAFLAGNS